MKVPFYTSETSHRSLRFHAAQLLGTPFAKSSMVPNGGIDCIHVNAFCYLKTGFMKEFHPPNYALDAGVHRKKSQLLEWLDSSLEFERVGNEKPRAGDTICFNMGLSEHHVGLMLDDKEFVHVLPERYVIMSSLNEPYYARHVTAIYRPVVLKEEKEAAGVR